MNRKMLIGILLIFLVLLIFLPRLLSLSLHWSSDEDLWMGRSRDFVVALEKGKFEDTLTAYHPGVTTTWVGGTAIWLASGRQSVSKWVESIQFFSASMLSCVRFPISFLAGLLILLIGGLLYRLFGVPVAVVGTVFLAFEPFLLADTRRVHTDVLTSEFLFLTFLLWLCYTISDNISLLCSTNF